MYQDIEGVWIIVLELIDFFHLMKELTLRTDPQAQDSDLVSQFSLKTRDSNLPFFLGNTIRNGSVVNDL